MTERERQVMKRLKEVVDKQRDEIRAKDRELTLKNDDIEAVRLMCLPLSPYLMEKLTGNVIIWLNFFMTSDNITTPATDVSVGRETPSGRTQ